MLKKKVLGKALAVMLAFSSLGAVASDKDYIVPEGLAEAVKQSKAQYQARKNGASENVTIDVLFLYDPSAQNALGLNGLYRYVEDSIDIANSHFGTTGVDVMVRSAGVIQTPYTEANQDASNLTDVLTLSMSHYPGDGMTEVGLDVDVDAGVYDQYGADAYVFLSGISDENKCGVAGIGTYTYNTRPAAQALSVASNCASLRAMFTHELGHNLGGGHFTGEAVYEYARPSNCGSGTTIMHSSVDQAEPGLFSNTVVEVNGEICGDANVADMKRMIEESAPILAATSEPASTQKDNLSVNVDATTISEESESAVSFTFTRDGDFSTEASFSYSVELTATGVSGVLASELNGELEGQVSFNIGESSKTVEIAMVDDSVVEDDEGFTLVVMEASMNGLVLADGESGRYEVVVTSGDEATTEPAQPEEPASSGGGSLGWMILLALSGAAFLRRKP